MEAALSQSRAFLNAITNSFHSINMARTGSEVLAGQVKRVVDAGLDDRVLEALFDLPLGVSGQNLRAFTQRDVEARTNDLAEMWFFFVFSRYESWAMSIEDDFGIAGASRGCQFPSGRGARGGYIEAFGSLTSNSLMNSLYNDTVRRDDRRLSSQSEIDAALTIYRYYKEIRNGLIHADGTASERLSIDSNLAAAALHEIPNNTKFRPISPVAEGEMIKIDLQLIRDSISLLFKLVFTIDSNILMSDLGASEFHRRWNRVHGGAVMARYDTLKRSPWFNAKVSHDLSMPYPVDPESQTGRTWPSSAREVLVEYGVRNGLIRRVV